MRFFFSVPILRIIAFLRPAERPPYVLLNLDDLFSLAPPLMAISPSAYGSGLGAQFSFSGP